MEFLNTDVLGIGWVLIWKPAAHFVSSGFVGLLVYWLTSTTLSKSSHNIIIFNHVFGTHRFSLSLALLFAIWVHILEDYTLGWF